MVTNVFHVGDDWLVTLPGEAVALLGLHEGGEVAVELDRAGRRVLLLPVALGLADIDAELALQVDQFIRRYRPALEALAR